MYELEARGVVVQLDEAAPDAALVITERHRSLDPREKAAQTEWVKMVLGRYELLIRLQLRMAEGLLPYRSVHWLLAHGYLEVRDKRYRIVRQ